MITWILKTNLKERRYHKARGLHEETEVRDNCGACTSSALTKTRKTSGPAVSFTVEKRRLQANRFGDPCAVRSRGKQARAAKPELLASSGV